MNVQVYAFRVGFTFTVIYQLVRALSRLRIRMGFKDFGFGIWVQV